MSDSQKHLERLRTAERHERAHAALMQQLPPPDAQWSVTRIRRNAELAQLALEEADTLAYAIRAIEERDELLKMLREVEAYGVPRFNRAIRDLLAKAERNAT